MPTVSLNLSLFADFAEHKPFDFYNTLRYCHLKRRVRLLKIYDVNDVFLQNSTCKVVNLLTVNTSDLFFSIKVRKTARIRNQYNEVPHLSQDTKRESNNITINIKINSQEVRPFPSGGNKAAMNRCESMANTKHKKKH